VELLTTFSDCMFPPLAGWLAWIAARARMYNLSITNLAGPQVPAYLLGAPLVGIYPLTFLFSHQALTVAVLSCNGGLYWSLTADPDALPSLRGLCASPSRNSPACTARRHVAAPDPGPQPARQGGSVFRRELHRRRTPSSAPKRHTALPAVEHQGRAARQDFRSGP